MKQSLAVHTLLGVGSTLYGIANPSPYQVYRRGHASAIPAWRALVIHQPLDAQSGGGSEEELATVAGFPTTDAARAEDGVAQATDLTDVDGLGDPAGAYFATVIHSTEERAARLFVEARDAGAVWLNGALLWQGPHWRSSRWFGPMALGRPYAVQLRACANVLLVKVGGDTARWTIGHFADGTGLTCATDPFATGVPLIRQEPLWVPVADKPSDSQIAAIATVGDAPYAGTSGHGILRFNDAAREWKETNDGLPTDEYVFVYDFLTLDNMLYAATSHGVCRLARDAERWKPRSGDLTDFYATAIAASDDWMFAGTWEGRIFRSPDRGASWEQVYSDPAGAKPGESLPDIARR